MVARIYRVTTDHCLERIRVNTHQQVMLIEPVRSVMTPACHPQDPMSVLRALLVNADPQQALCAVYFYLDGLQQAEVAVLMGVSPRAVGVLIERFRTWAKGQIEVVELVG